MCVLLTTVIVEHICTSALNGGPGGISKNAEVDMTAAHNAATVTLN